MESAREINSYPTRQTDLLPNKTTLKTNNMKKLKSRPAHEITCIAMVLLVFLYLGFQIGRVIIQNHFPHLY